jgi:hypothetical protein
LLQTANETTLTPSHQLGGNGGTSVIYFATNGVVVVLAEEKETWALAVAIH